MKDNVVVRFIEENRALFGSFKNYERGLYLKNDCDEIIVIECPEYNHKKRTFVIKFDCGSMYEINTEFDSFDGYMILIPRSECADYICF